MLEVRSRISIDVKFCGLISELSFESGLESNVEIGFQIRS